MFIATKSMTANHISGGFLGFLLSSSPNFRTKKSFYTSKFIGALGCWSTWYHGSTNKEIPGFLVLPKKDAWYSNSGSHCFLGSRDSVGFDPRSWRLVLKSYFCEFLWSYGDGISCEKGREVEKSLDFWEIQVRNLIELKSRTGGILRGSTYIGFYSDGTSPSEGWDQSSDDKSHLASWC